MQKDERAAGRWIENRFVSAEFYVSSLIGWLTSLTKFRTLLDWNCKKTSLQDVLESGEHNQILHKDYILTLRGRKATGDWSSYIVMPHNTTNVSVPATRNSITSSFLIKIHKITILISYFHILRNNKNGKEHQPNIEKNNIIAILPENWTIFILFHFFISI